MLPFYTMRYYSRTPQAWKFCFKVDCTYSTLFYCAVRFCTTALPYPPHPSGGEAPLRGGRFAAPARASGWLIGLGRGQGPAFCLPIAGYFSPRIVYYDIVSYSTALGRGQGAGIGLSLAGDYSPRIVYREYRELACPPTSSYESRRIQSLTPYLTDPSIYKIARSNVSDLLRPRVRPPARPPAPRSGCTRLCWRSRKRKGPAA